jgi:hypothetical protein
VENIIEQLNKIYYNEEYWHTSKLSEEEATKYHSKLLDKGNILLCQELGVVLGYVEVWRINFEQFGRLICKEKFSAYLEDVSKGNIAYVANVWVDPKFRNSSVIKTLKLLFFKHNYMCEYFVGEALRKSTQPIKVFKKDSLSSKLFKEGLNG